jgi:hypothetical protein
MDDTKLDTELDIETEEGKAFIEAIEEVIKKIKDGDIPGEYLEF